jgi:hypothetical protein
MNTDRKQELVIECGFNEYSPKAFKRNIFANHTEYWTPSAPDIIDFADQNGNHTETYHIDWALFN